MRVVVRMKTPLWTQRSPQYFREEFRRRCLYALWFTLGFAAITVFAIALVPPSL